MCSGIGLLSYNEISRVIEKKVFASECLNFAHKCFRFILIWPWGWCRFAKCIQIISAQVPGLGCPSPAETWPLPLNRRWKFNYLNYPKRQIYNTGWGTSGKKTAMKRTTGCFRKILSVCKGPPFNGFIQYILSWLDISAVTKLPNETLWAVTLTNIRSEKFFLVERPVVTFLSVIWGWSNTKPIHQSWQNSDFTLELSALQKLYGNWTQTTVLPVGKQTARESSYNQSEFASGSSLALFPFRPLPH